MSDGSDEHGRRDAARSSRSYQATNSEDHNSRRRSDRPSRDSDGDVSHRRRRRSRDRSDHARGDDLNDSSQRRRRRRRSRDRAAPTRRDREYRDRSDRSRERRRSRSRSRSPATKRRRRSFSEDAHSRCRSRSRSPQPPSRRSRAPLPSQDESFHGPGGERGTKPLLDADGKPIEKQKPNFKPTGLLAKEANTVAGTTTVLKYHEPAEARKPPSREQWRLYIFKKKDLLDTIFLHHRSAWLMGRDEKVTDLLLEHPSISKQHAVIQFRHISSTNEFGDKLSRVKPYLIDLDSANGTKLNGEKIGPSRYVELVDGDVVAFGDSEREYVLMLPPAEK